MRNAYQIRMPIFGANLRRSDNKIPLIIRYISEKAYSLNPAPKTSGNAPKIFFTLKAKCPGSLVVRRRSRKPFLLWESAGSNPALGVNIAIIKP